MSGRYDMAIASRSGMVIFSHAAVCAGRTLAMAAICSLEQFGPRLSLRFLDR